MKLYIVGDKGPEHNHVWSAHKTHKGAFQAWNALRLKLLTDAKASLKRSDKYTKKMYAEMVKNLSCKDPKKIDNYPQETPYVREINLQE